MDVEKGKKIKTNFFELFGICVEGKLILSYPLFLQGKFTDIHTQIV